MERTRAARPAGSTNGQRHAGLSIHLVTASGVLAGFLALEAAFGGEVRRALLWLVACQILDGIDGPIARKLDVTVHAPHIDGHVLDLVVDYVTCVVVPTVLLVHLHLPPARVNSILVAAILVSSALWFARVDQETEDAWFRGFPGMWNIVVPSFILLDSSRTTVAVTCLVGCVLQLSNVEFPHILRARALRPLTVSVTVLYFATFVLLSATYPDDRWGLRNVLLVAPLYLAAIVVWRTFFPERTVLGHRITPVAGGAA